MYGEAGLQGCLKRVPAGSTLLNLLTHTHSPQFSLFYELCIAYHSVSKQHMNTRGHARNLSIATAKECQRKVYLLPHLVENMKDFGPCCGFSTESMSTCTDVPAVSLSQENQLWKCKIPVQCQNDTGESVGQAPGQRGQTSGWHLWETQER